MSRKNLKLSDTSKDLLNNFDLWEELEDQTGEQISGGGTFSFVNKTELNIPIALFNENVLLEEIIINPSIEAGTQAVNIPGINEIIVEYNNLDPAVVQPVEEPMISTERGIFDLLGGIIIFNAV